uniref:Dysbindin domain-containing protein 1 n=2 Tax=Gasterosteus aculeatus TaxID=69293 RepID=A0AAQ4R4M5_GASAC
SRPAQVTYPRSLFTGRLGRKRRASCRGTLPACCTSPRRDKPPCAPLSRGPTDRFTEPLSSVSSLEVHFDLLDLTELTDMSDQELAEVFADSDEDIHNESPAGSHHPLLPRAGCMRSPSWTRCSKVEPPRERKHHSDSDTAEPLTRLERPKQL